MLTDGGRCCLRCPDTDVRWQRESFRRHWRWKSRRRYGALSKIAFADLADVYRKLCRLFTELVTLCRDKIQAAEVQVKTITEQLERDVPDTPDPADSSSA